ncbi:hypothetical protein CLOSBL3_20249 [Clostridiaceae bacterium BL-3]|nr:hypothetical protein CLOSBL3_20249 [Clostridiaceae bacterium BL-3]
MNILFLSLSANKNMAKHIDVCIEGKQLSVIPAAALELKCLASPSGCPSTYHTSCR